MTKATISPNVRLFVLAGEASGDVIGADLITTLRAKINLSLTGVGGEQMQAVGLKSMFPITDLSVMGYVDVILRLPLLLWRVRQVVQKILSSKPDVVVLIDSQVFSNLVAKQLKKMGFSAPIILYVCPTVWGYKPERAAKIRSLYDEVLAILPFEPAVMEELGGPPCQFVGHPTLAHSPRLKSQNNAETIILMPGSRKGELRRHLPMLKPVVQQLALDEPNTKFVILTLPYLVSIIETQIKDWAVSVRIETKRENRNQIFAQAKLALVVAGTATLELAMARVPMVVNYVMDVGQIRIKNSIDVKHFALPNLILDEAIVPELLFEQPNPDALLRAARELLQDPTRVRAQIESFAIMEQKLRQGTPRFPREDAASRVLSHLQPT